MILRKYSNDDLEAIEKMNSFFAITIKYHGDINEEDVLCIVDRDEKLIGVGYLKYDKKFNTKGKYSIEFSTLLDEEHQGNMKIDGMLMDGLINRYHEIKNANPQKELCLRICCETAEINDMEFFLDNGFSLNSVIPVLKYNLLKETKHYDIPDNVQIKEYSFSEENLQNYLDADFEASGIPESKADIRFKGGDPNFKCFVATYDSKIVGAISIWNITDKRAATENIFVIPSFRRKNIARELIATAFDELKERGMEIATLSMSGTNLRAMKLYLSSGYSLYYNLIEMIYE